MRKLFRLFTALLLCSLSFYTYSQDFSNKGTDFWVGYGYHVNMLASSNSQEMVLYFATDQATNVTVSIPLLGYSQSYSIPANTSFTSNPLPKAGTYDATLTTEGTLDKGIHIVSDKPIVAYTHIYNSSISGATLLFPTPTLGKEYYSVNYTQVSNNDRSNCWFYVIAVDTGTTAVEITPSAKTTARAANATFTVNLKQGQVYNVMGALNSPSSGGTFTGSDLTGSFIKSVSTGASGCKRIAVFSGSGKLSISCTNTAGSSDNCIIQAFPKNAWGKKYLTVPTKTLPNNFFRICVSDPSTVVKVNGSPLSGLINNFYYELSGISVPQLIEGDKPILVAQYITTQGSCGNGSPGDPEIIYLSPVEQNIDKVILNSTPNYNITQHWINVVLRNSGIGSFKIDGNAATFTTHPQDANYSYAQISVGAGQHTLQSDSGFNAIAYGYGNAESYGYNAGTNVKDLYQFVSIKNQYATVNYPAGCRASPFFLAITFPYQPTQIQWKLAGIGYQDTTLNLPAYDSTWMVNGKQLYLYRLANPYVVNTIGTYPIRIIAQNTSSEGCTGEQEVNYDLQIYERPSATFSFTNSGCLGDKVQFAGASTAAGQKVILLDWDLGDGSKEKTDKFDHIYAAPKTYDVKYSVITEIGCVSDTITKQVVINPLPVAKFEATVPACINKTVSFTDKSSVAAPSTLAKWYWDFGDNSTPVVATTNATQIHSYTSTGSFTVTLKVETAAGCTSTVYSQSVEVHENPVPGFILPDNCLNDVISKFTDTTKIADGTAAAATYLWNFGDGAATPANPNTFTGQAAQHKYTAAGYYNVKEVVISKFGCADSVTRVFTVNGASPKAGFTFTSGPELCSNLTAGITNSSSVDFGRITRLEIYWDYAGDPTNKTTASYPATAQTFLNKYPEFYTPATKTYEVRMVAYSGDACLNTLSQTITLKNTPDVYFNNIAPVCADVPAFQLTAAGTNNTIAGSGVFTGRGVNSAGLFTPALARIGTDSLQYTYTGTNGCVNSKKGTVTVYAVPVADAGADRFVLEGGSTPLLGKGTGNGLSYLWTPATYLSSATIAQPVTTPLADISYSLKVTSAEGCSDSDDATVTVLKTPLIPNVFTPNGDGINDTWVIAYLDSYPGSTVQVYNRYGQVIFQSAGSARPWDGTYKGSPVPAGTYYYIINPKNGRQQLSGYVDIVR